MNPFFRPFLSSDARTDALFTSELLRVTNETSCEFELKTEQEEARQKKNVHTDTP